MNTKAVQELITAAEEWIRITDRDNVALAHLRMALAMVKAERAQPDGILDYNIIPFHSMRKELTAARETEHAALREELEIQRQLSYDRYEEACKWAQLHSDVSVELSELQALHAALRATTSEAADMLSGIACEGVDIAAVADIHRLALNAVLDAVPKVKS